MLGYYYHQLNRCKNLKSAVGQAVNILTETKNSYQDMSNTVSINYKINEEDTNLSKKINQSKLSIEKILNYMSTTVIGKIDAEIARLNKLIEEELEKLRAASSGGYKKGTSR